MPSSMETQTKRDEETSEIPTVAAKVEAQPAQENVKKSPGKKAARL